MWYDGEPGEISYCCKTGSIMTAQCSEWKVSHIVLSSQFKMNMVKVQMQSPIYLPEQFVIRRHWVRTKRAEQVKINQNTNSAIFVFCNDNMIM